MQHLSISGSARHTGEALGAFGRDAWQRIICVSPLGKAVFALKDGPEAMALRQATQQAFPLIWQEIEGLAVGLGAPVDEVFAWQCRGDLVRSTSDGCTTVAGTNTGDSGIIAHNEDGMPALRGTCAIVSIQQETGPAFTSFAYPGSLCGHTFAVNAHGVVNAVNNIRAIERPAGLPRQVLARASLNARTLDDAVDILTTYPRSGAFHHTLGQAGDHRLLSVEATGTGYSINPIGTGFGHSNHLVSPSLSTVAQVITTSSANRQQRVNEWFSTRHDALTAGAALTILSDQTEGGLPVYRQSPDDPDGENTLATAVFTLSPHQVLWDIYGDDRHRPILSGAITLQG